MKHTKRILLLGGSGYIGSHIKDVLSNPYFIVEAPSSQKLPLQVPDEIEAFLRHKNYDYTVYSVINKRIPQFDYNIKNLRNILVHKSKLGRFVLISSRAIYDTLPAMDFFSTINISDIPKPHHNSYSYLKYMEETIVNKEMDDFLIFRLFDTFDDDILNSGPLPIWVKRHKKGILQFDEEITPIHVHSASEIISNCISNDIAKGTYNICSNHIVSSDEVLNKLLLKHDNYIEKKSRKGQNSFPDYVDSRCWEKFFKF